MEMFVGHTFKSAFILATSMLEGLLALIMPMVLVQALTVDSIQLLRICVHDFVFLQFIESL
jgi:hypothetical protein